MAQWLRNNPPKPSYLKTDPCIKCGDAQTRLEYIGTYGQTKGGTILVTCSRCGYAWTMPTLDAEPQDRTPCRYCRYWPCTCTAAGDAPINPPPGFERLPLEQL